MEFKNGYNFMYQKAKEIYASKVGRPAADDEAVDFGLTEEEKKNIKLVYENKDGLVVSFNSLPSADDTQIQATINGELVIGPSEDTPTALFKLKTGDKFVDLHFDMLSVPNKDDFNWTDGDGFISVIAAFKWYQRGSTEDVEVDAFAAQYIPEGTEIDGLILDKDFLMLMDFNGRPIYVSDVEIAKEIFGSSFSDLTDGWQVGSFKEFIEKYEMDWDLSEASYGELLAKIPGEEDYIPDYVQAANGKVYGFKQSDYYKEPGPTPTSLIPLVNNTEYNITDIVFDTTKKPNIKDFTLIEEEDMKFAELCGFNITDGKRHIGTGLIVVDYSNATPPGGQQLPDNSFALGTAEGFYPLYVSNQELLDAFFIGLLHYDNAVVGWNGASLLEVNNKFDTQHEPLSENAVAEAIIPEDENEPVYNGKLIGAIKAEPGPTPPVPPAPSLEEMKDGNEFVNFHFNTSSVPTKNDFNLIYNEDGSAMAVLFGLDWEPHGGTYIYAGFFPQGYEFGDDYTLDQDSFGIFGQGLMPMLYADAGMTKLLNDMFKGEITIEPGWQGATLKEAAAIMHDDEFDEGHGTIEGMNDGVSPEFVGFISGDRYK